MRFVDLHAWNSPLSCMDSQNDSCCTGWDSTVRKLAQRLSRQLGVADTTYVEACLENVTLVSEDSSYNFGTSADTPPGTFANMTVMKLPPTKVVLWTKRHFITLSCSSEGAQCTCLSQSVRSPKSK